MAYLDGIKRVEDLNLDGKRVFVRVDFNVPLDNGVITDDNRIRQANTTIQYIIRHVGLPVVASHLGRPKSNPIPEFSLKPVAERLSELLPEREVVFAEDCVGDGVVEQSKRLEPGQILLLENLRFYEEEEGKPRGKFSSDEEKAAAKKALKESQKKFAESLAALADVYVNDAFGTCHRAHASMATMVPFFGENKGCGYLLEKEIKFLGNIVYDPEHPFVAVMGGAKVSDKIGVIESLIEKCDQICIGGAMAYTLLAAKGVDVASSRVEKEAMDIAKSILEIDGQWDEERIEKFFKEAGEHPVDLKTPIDVFIDYHTVTVDDRGQPYFLADIYRYIRDEITPLTPEQMKCDPAIDKTSAFRSGEQADTGP